jgi:hypothetical protein
LRIAAAIAAGRASTGLTSRTPGAFLISSSTSTAVGSAMTTESTPARASNVTGTTPNCSATFTGTLRSVAGSTSSAASRSVPAKRT